jgi:hypothetical protein
LGMTPAESAADQEAAALDAHLAAYRATLGG